MNYYKHNKKFFDPEQLIAEVQKRPPLYQKDISEYHDRSLKQVLWFEIGAVFNENWNKMNDEEKSAKCEEIQKKWRNIRDNYRKDYYLQKREDGKKRRRYLYAELLEFLNPYFKHEQIDLDITNLNNYDLLSSNFKNYDIDEVPVSSFKGLPLTIVSDTNQNNQKHSMKLSTTLSKNSKGLQIESEENGKNLKNEYKSTEKDKNKKSSKRKYSEKRFKSKKKRLDIFEKCLLSIIKEKTSDSDTPTKEVIKGNKDTESIDEDKSFLISLLPSFSKLNGEQKLIAKVGFLNILRQVTYQSSSICGSSNM